MHEKRKSDWDDDDDDDDDEKIEFVDVLSLGIHSWLSCFFHDLKCIKCEEKGGTRRRRRRREEGRES